MKGSPKEPLRYHVCTQCQNPGAGKAGCKGIHGVRRRAFPGFHVKQGFFDAFAQSDGAVIKTRGQDVCRSLSEGEQGVRHEGTCPFYRVIPLIAAKLRQRLGKRCGVAVGSLLCFLNSVGPRRLHVCGSGARVGFCRRHAFGLQRLGEAVHVGRTVKDHVLIVKGAAVQVSDALHGTGENVLPIEHFPLALDLPLNACRRGVGILPAAHSRALVCLILALGKGFQILVNIHGLCPLRGVLDDRPLDCGSDAVLDLPCTHLNGVAHDVADVGGWVGQHGGVPPEIGLLHEGAGDLVCNGGGDGVPRRRPLRVRLCHQVVGGQLVREGEARHLVDVVHPCAFHVSAVSCALPGRPVLPCRPVIHSVYQPPQRQQTALRRQPVHQIHGLHHLCAVVSCVRNGRCQLKGGLVVSFGNGKVVGADGLGGVRLGDPLSQLRLSNETVRHLAPAVPCDLGLCLLHGAPVRRHVIVERAAGNGVFIHGCHLRGGQGAVQNGGDRFLHIPPGIRVYNGNLRGRPPLFCLDTLGAVGIHRVKLITLGLHGVKGCVHRTRHGVTRRVEPRRTAVLDIFRPLCYAIISIEGTRTLNRRLRLCPSVTIGGKAGWIGTIPGVYFYNVPVRVNHFMQIKSVFAGALYNGSYISSFAVHSDRGGKYIAVIGASFPILLEINLLPAPEHFRNGGDHGGLCPAYAMAQIVLHGTPVDVNVSKAGSSHNPLNGLKHFPCLFSHGSALDKWDCFGGYGRYRLCAVKPRYTLSQPFNDLHCLALVCRRLHTGDGVLRVLCGVCGGGGINTLPHLRACLLRGLCARLTASTLPDNVNTRADAAHGRAHRRVIQRLAQIKPGRGVIGGPLQKGLGIIFQKFFSALGDHGEGQPPGGTLGKVAHDLNGCVFAKFCD